MIFLMLCKLVFIALRVRYSTAVSTQFFAIIGHFRALRDESRGNSACMALKPHRHPRRNGVQEAGRMCEVGPPCKHGVPLHFPLFAPAALNGNPALRGHRRTPE